MDRENPKGGKGLTDANPALLCELPMTATTTTSVVVNN
jgi:hypothetical protein